MSIPRVLTLDADYTLIQTPAEELQPLRNEHIHKEQICLRNETKRIAGAEGTALEIRAEMSGNGAAAFGLIVRASSDGTRGIYLKYTDRILDIDDTRTPTDLDPDSILKLHTFLNRSVLEVFIGNGSQAVTSVFYVPDDDAFLDVIAEMSKATLTRPDVWRMNPAC